MWCRNGVWHEYATSTWSGLPHSEVVRAIRIKLSRNVCSKANTHQHSTGSIECSPAWQRVATMAAGEKLFDWAAPKIWPTPRWLTRYSGSSVRRRLQPQHHRRGDPLTRPRGSFTSPLSCPGQGQFRVWDFGTVLKKRCWRLHGYATASRAH